MTADQVDQVERQFEKWEGVAVATSARGRFACHKAMAKAADMNNDTRLEHATFHSPRCQIKYWRSVLFTADGNLYRVAVESFSADLPPE